MARRGIARERGENYQRTSDAATSAASCRTMRGSIAAGSELEPKRELQLAVVEPRAGDLTEERIAELGHGIAHDQVIEGVERLDTELQSCALQSARMFLTSERSTELIPGPVTVPIPPFPNVYCGGQPRRRRY